MISQPEISFFFHIELLILFQSYASADPSCSFSTAGSVVTVADFSSLSSVAHSNRTHSLSLAVRRKEEEAKETVAVGELVPRGGEGKAHQVSRGPST